MNICDAIKVYESLFIHNNFSEHIPVFLKLDINISYTQMAKDSRIRKTNWDKWDAETLENYKSCIDNRISQLNYNSDALSCQNIKCNLHSDHISHLYDCMIEICDDASNKYLPKTGDINIKEKRIPGWNEKVKPYLDKLLLFNSMLVHGIAPSSRLIGTMTPIIKDGRESHKNSSNYRTLTIGTSLSKVFDILVIKNQSRILPSNWP